MLYFPVADRFHGCYLVQNLSKSEHQKSTWTWYTNRYSRQRRLQEPFPVVQQHEGGGINHDEEAGF